VAWWLFDSLEVILSQMSWSSQHLRAGYTVGHKIVLLTDALQHYSPLPRIDDDSHRKAASSPALPCECLKFLASG
jgi:hypothetical protein